MAELIDVREGLADLPIAAGLPAAAFAYINGPRSGLEGLGLGAVLGFVLHLVPRSFPQDQSRSSRVAVRALTGALGGAALGSAAPRMAGDPDPETSEIVRAMKRGFVAGAAVYALWGLIEPRRERL